MSGEAQVRFRHTCGVDSGPYAFAFTDTIDRLKTKLLEEWPSGEPGQGAAAASDRAFPGLPASILPLLHAFGRTAGPNRANRGARSLAVGPTTVARVCCRGTACC